MAATALIKFTQGALTDVAGRALLGALGTSVAITNGSNTGVLSWSIELLYVPPGSALTVGTLASNFNDSTPTASFTPDVRGCYRFRLTVWGAINYAGIHDADIRVFGIAFPNGFIDPPVQIFPPPLPDPASGLPDSKPNELNFGGQTNGWGGDNTVKLMHQLVKKVDDLQGSSLVPPSVDVNQYGYAFKLSDPDLFLPLQITFDATDYWVGSRISQSSGRSSGYLRGSKDSLVYTENYNFPDSLSVVDIAYEPTLDRMVMLRYNSSTGASFLVPVTRARPSVPGSPVTLTGTDHFQVKAFFGYLWTNSSGGLFRYNPNLSGSFQVDSSSITGGFGADTTTTRYGNGRGRIFATSNPTGVVRYDPQVGTLNSPDATFLPSGMSASSFLSLSVDEAGGRVWTSYYNYTLGYFEVASFDCQPLGSNMRTLRLDTVFQPFSVCSVAWDPTHNRAYLTGISLASSPHLSIVAIQDSGSALSTVAAPTTWSTLYSTGAGSFQPQLSLKDGYVWTPSDANSPRGPLLKVDPLTFSYTAFPFSYPDWGIAFKPGGDLTGTATSQTVSNLQGVPLSLSSNPGWALINYGSFYGLAALPHIEETATTGSTHTLGSGYLGLKIRRNSLTPLSTAVPTPSSGSTVRMYYSDISGNLGEGRSPVTLTFSINLLGARNSAVTSFVMNSAYESLEVEWNSTSAVWVLVQRHRKWEDVSVTSSMTLFSGYASCRVSTAAARTLTLRASPQHDDQVIIKDITGSANTNNITINGNGANIDGSASYVLNRARGAVQLRYDVAIPGWTLIGAF